MSEFIGPQAPLLSASFDDLGLIVQDQMELQFSLSTANEAGIQIVITVTVTVFNMEMATSWTLSSTCAGSDCCGISLVFL